MPPLDRASLFTRRRFLQAAAASAVAVPVYSLFRFYQPVSRAKAKIAVVGAGSAGLNIAARLNRALAEPRITIIDPSPNHYYQAGFTLVAAGVFSPRSVVREQLTLIPDGVKWIQDEVTSFEPDVNRLQTREHGAVDYDFLVLAPGIEMHFDAIEGLRREDLGKGNVHCIYDFESSRKCWTAIQELAKTGGRALFTDTWTKLKCGGAPKKILMIAEHYSRLQNARDRVDFRFLTATEALYDIPLFRKRLEEIFSERRLPVEWNHRVKAVDTDARKVTFEKHSKVSENGQERSLVETVTREFDFLHIVPPMSAPKAVRESALSVNPKTGKAEDWVPAVPDTLRHASYANVFVAGDAAGIPTSKTGAAIKVQAPVVAANVIAAMENREPTARYDGYAACPFITEYGKVLMAEFRYDKKPAPTLPLLDPGREHTAGWVLKRHVLRPMYFDLMLRGLA